MQKYYEVERNILDYLFVSYDCFNNHCHGVVVISLGNLRRNIRAQCPICKREDSLVLQGNYLDVVERNFGYLYRQLDGLELLPLAFSPAVSPKTVFLDSKQEDNTY